MRRAAAVALLLGSLVVACSGGSDEVLTRDAVFDDVGPIEAPAPASTEDVRVVVDGVNALGLDLLRQLEPAGGNALLAPWSISEGLALPYLGARGVTQQEMEAVLHVGLDGDRHHAALYALRNELRSRQNDDLVIAAANRVFGQEGMALTDQYLADLSRYYEAPLSMLDFGDPEAARGVINEWVADQTEDKIPELFPSGAIDPDTRLALVNAIYLKASWHLPFNAELTEDEPFTRLDGNTVLVPTMHFNEYLPSGYGEGWQVVQLPYTGEEVSLLVIVPDDFAAFAASFDTTTLDAVRGSITEGGIHLGLPRFELSHHASLIEPLQRLGLRSPFSGAADFSGITGAPGLFIDAIEHETFVKVDEEGTEAAAATGSAMAASHGPTINVNQPFLFVVQDDATGAVLFLGRVTDPLGG